MKWSRNALESKKHSQRNKHFFKVLIYFLLIHYDLAWTSVVMVGIDTKGKKIKKTSEDHSQISKRVTTRFDLKDLNTWQASRVPR